MAPASDPASALAGRLLRWPLLRQAASAAPVSDPIVSDDAARGSSELRRGRLQRFRLVGVIVLASGGWLWGAWEHFVAAPGSRDVARVTLSLDMVDRFADTEAHRVYVQLAADMKPWWESIDDLQRRIQAAPNEEARDALIAERDASLLAYVHDHGLERKLDLLISSFDDFVRCLDTGACDQDILDKSIGIDVRRIYRTFRPYILMKRGGGDPRFGKDLEDLFFRFLG